MLKLKSLNTRDALRAAATKGCMEAVRFLLEEGVDKDAADKEGNTPIMLASQNNHQVVMQFLREFKTDKKNGADMSLKLKSLNTRDALRAALNKGCMEAVRFLVKEGVSQIDADKEGRTPLMSAILAGHTAVARYLVESMQKGNRGSWGSAAFEYCAMNGFLAEMQWLSEQGADKEKANNGGYTALILATHYGRLTVVEWLLEQGVDVNKATNDGWTALHCAVCFDRSELITCLMKWGADLTAKTHGNAWNAAQLPIDMTSNEDIKRLIRDEETRRNNHGYKRAVIPNPTDEERKRARLDRGEEEEEGQGQGQGQASANAIAEEDDGENDDSGSELEYD